MLVPFARGTQAPSRASSSERREPDGQRSRGDAAPEELERRRRRGSSARDAAARGRRRRRRRAASRSPARGDRLAERRLAAGAAMIAA